LSKALELIKYNRPVTVPGYHTGTGLQASLPGLVHLQFLITVLAYCK